MILDTMFHIFYSRIHHCLKESCHISHHIFHITDIIPDSGIFPVTGRQHCQAVLRELQSFSKLLFIHIFLNMNIIIDSRAAIYHCKQRILIYFCQRSKYPLSKYLVFRDIRLLTIDEIISPIVKIKQFIVNICPLNRIHQYQSFQIHSRFGKIDCQ